MNVVNQIMCLTMSSINVVFLLHFW